MGPLNCLHHFHSFFFLLLLLGASNCPLILLILSSPLSSLWLNFYCVFFSWVIVFSALWLLLDTLSFLSLCSSSHCVHPLFWVWWASLWALLWTYYQVDGLSFFLVLFLSFCFVLLFEIYSFITLFFLTLCICFCVLGRSFMSPALGGRALCKRHPIETRNIILPWVPESGATGWKVKLLPAHHTTVAGANCCCYTDGQGWLPDELTAMPGCDSTGALVGGASLQCGWL